MPSREQAESLKSQLDALVQQKDTMGKTEQLLALVELFVDTVETLKSSPKTEMSQMSSTKGAG